MDVPTSQATQQPHVAVLLATYNGARFVEAQLRSLMDNTTGFTLHWIDDHSTDGTREVVRTAARDLKITLAEWHQDERLGVPGTFFELLERADADVYLFCDQDDIWQPGKIDATVANLLPDLRSPVLCFSDPLLFYEEEPDVFHRVSDIMDIRAPAALEASRALMSTPVAGQTVGITLPLRQLYLSHRQIAREHAFMHSWWLYIIALASGTARMLPNVPTTLYRRHAHNQTAGYYPRNRKSIDHIALMWKQQRPLRVGMARQARGFIAAASTLPSGPKAERLLAIARLVAAVDQRQSPAALARLVFRRAMWPSWERSFWLVTACLWGDATT